MEALVRFRKPARLDDLLEVRCWVSERRRASFRFAYEIRNEEGEPVATGSTLHACLDPATSAMVAVPSWLLRADADRYRVEVSGRPLYTR